MNFLRELRFAARALQRKPGFSLVVVLTVAIAIAACTTIYSIVHAVLIRPLPYPEAERLVQVWQVNRGAEGREGQFSDPNFEDLRDRSRAFAALGQYASGAGTLIAGNVPMRAQMALVSQGFFDVFQIAPARGRVFAVEDAHLGAAPVAVVSHRLWTQALGGANLSGATIKESNRTYAVIGVMPPHFAFPEGVDVWLPREQVARNPYRTGHNWRVVGRVAEGVPLAAAREDVTRVARQLEESLGDDTHMVDVALVPLHEQLVRAARPALLVLSAAVACLLIIACANLANLLIVHASGRRRELAVRSALGGGRAAVALPLLVETALLTGLGGGLGVLAGAAALRMAIAFEPGALPRLDEIGISGTVLLVSLAVTILTAVVLGLGVAWRAARRDVSASLRGSGRGQAGSPGATRLRNGLVVAPLAISLVLLAAAGLLGRSLALLLSEDPGFRTEQVLAIDVEVPGGPPEAEARRVRFQQQLLERLRALPGIRSAGGVSRFPLSTGYSNGTFLKVTGTEQMQSMEQLAALMKDSSRTGEAEFRVVTPEYFETMNIPLLRGRAFEDGDTEQSPHVAVISESLARRSWPGAEPIGQKVQFGGMDGDLRVFTIVGVVADIRERGLDSEVRPTLYADYRQRPRVTGAFTFVLHTAGNPSSLIPPARAALRELDPEVAPRFRPIAQVFAESVADRRFSLLVLGAFAGVALLLAVLGIYGVLSYLVSQRMQEFGVRVALGAQRSDLWRLVVGQGLVLVGAGVVIGLLAANAVTRVIGSMLYNVTPNDPLTFAGVIAVLVVTALAACQLPAMRATRADPLTVLRSE